MTDTIVDDDLNKPTTSSSRRPMFIETEMRTDTITRRRVGSINNRSVHDILENTKSPTEYVFSIGKIFQSYGTYSFVVDSHRQLIHMLTGK